MKKFRDQVIIPVKGQDYALSIVCVNDGKNRPEVALVTKDTHEYIKGTQTFVYNSLDLIKYISVVNGGISLTLEKYDDWNECNLEDL